MEIQLFTYKEQAILNYYIRLVNRGIYKIEMVPIKFRNAVELALLDLEPPTPLEGEY